MSDFSNIDVEKLVVAWEEEDLWNISGENYHKKDARHRPLSRIQEKIQNETGKTFYSYLDLPFSALLVRHDVLQKHFVVLSKVLSSSSS